jgi:DNA helicase II / ATP-dependent DNA helicase PcrA
LAASGQTRAPSHVAAPAKELASTALAADDTASTSLDAAPELELDGRQLEAVTADPERPLLIVAGAGTGKTQVLAERAVWLAEQGIPPSRLMLLTFSRRAARGMLDRVAAATGAEREALSGGTFHSVGCNVIRRHRKQLDLPENFNVIDSEDVADLIDLIRNQRYLPVSGRRVPSKQTLANIYSRTVNAQRPLEEIVRRYFPASVDYVPQAARLFRELGARKQDKGLLDFDDLLLYWQALASNEITGPVIAEAFQHVLVDEYQDVNGLQVEIVQSLHRHGCGVTAVGDDMQAIYGFRAATREHILNFPEQFADSQLVTLERNYRTTTPIITVANAVAAAAAHSYPRTLIAAEAEGGAPELIHAANETAEANEVVDRILEHYESGIALADQAVLMRAGRHATELEFELTRRKIPFSTFGGLGQLETAHVKDLLALIRAVLNTNDQVAWLRVLKLIHRIGDKTAGLILDQLADPLAETLPAIDATLPPHVVPGWQKFRLRLIEATSGADVPVGLLKVLEPLVRAKYRKITERLEDLKTLVEIAQQAPDLKTFIDDLTLDDANASATRARPTLGDDVLTLSTIHAAKGLEWTVVHLIRLNDGDIPSSLALATEDELEEERRLLYVAVTRPRRHLHLYRPLRSYATKTSSSYHTKQSRFIDSTIEAHLLTIYSGGAPTVEPADETPLAAIRPQLEHLWTPPNRNREPKSDPSPSRDPSEQARAMWSKSSDHLEPVFFDRALRTARMVDARAVSSAGRAPR